MTEQEMRIAIAEACGWKRKGYKMWTNPADLSWEYASGLPDYLNDLNAMHEAEKALDQMQARAYADNLAESKQDGTCASCHMWHQSAAQRAEAFLKALNIWTE